jgi:hypothetical protein
MPTAPPTACCAGPGQGRSPSCAGCAFCRTSIFWTETILQAERRAPDRRSPSAGGMLIVTARWSVPPPPRTSLKRSRRASSPGGNSVFKKKAPAETGAQG